MRFVFILLLLLNAHLLLADTEADRALTSKMRAEIYAQELTDAGEYEKAGLFLEQAIGRYPDSDTLLMFKGTSHFYLKELDEAKKYFRLVLEIDPRNEQASKFIKTIEEQEAAKENEAVGKLLNYLNDKGFDFLMIFLAFLGGEIIARRYNECGASESGALLAAFKARGSLARSLRARAVYTVSRCCLSRNVLTFCFFLEVLVSVIIAVTLLIVWLLAEFLFGITLFLEESLPTLSAEAIWHHVFVMFAVMMAVTLLLRLWTKVRGFESRPERYALALVAHLETLYDERAYGRFYDLLEAFSWEELEVLGAYVHDDRVRLLMAQRREEAS